ncbi:MAG: D-2-hydroxyacid dehydrogenase [Oscillospiraceae bacterium]|nr:D-2-hydroxyacid dehydrogenase [Oscillospiraceae bacterium]
MLKMVSLDEYVQFFGEVPWDGIRAFGELTLYDRTPKELIHERIKDADVVFITKTPLGAAEFDAAPHLELICVVATGYNMIDTAEAARRGIVVCNAPGYSTESVVQHTFALLLELCVHVGEYSPLAHGPRWVENDGFSFLDFPVTEICGKTLGIVGFGAIGRRVAQVALAFGMKVLYNRRAGADAAVDGANIGYADLDALFRESDVVTLHCPLTPETKGLVNAARIASMKDGAMLINTARGPIIEDRALADALNAGKLAGAGLDVMTTEPPKADNPLLTAKNVVLTPHIAWAPLEARRRLMTICEDNVKAFVAGRPIHRVN